uniref:Tctex1 domain containing 1 n=1 Tax=Leptobrachium leishanense TaxID=445787 RepID=A0A8C5QHM6_9ANUR
QDSGLKKKAVIQDNAKTPSRLGPDAMEIIRTSVTPFDMDLHPQPRKCFSAEEASKVIKSVLDKQLQDMIYDATNSHRLALELAELVKMAVRQLGYERYKLVCFVVLGPVSQGTLCCSSRSVWSPNSDTYAEYLYQNRSLFALCVVYAGYYE